MRRRFASIDISDSLVCALIVEIDSQGRLEITGAASVPSRSVVKGVVADQGGLSDTIKKAIEKAKEPSGQKIFSCAINISGPRLDFRTSHGIAPLHESSRRVKHSDISRAIKVGRTIGLAPDMEVVNVIPQTFLLDGEGPIKNPAGMYGVRLESDIFMVIAPRTQVANLVESVNGAGLSVDSISFTALATAFGVCDWRGDIHPGNAGSASGFVIVDAKRDLIDVAYFKDGYIRAADTVTSSGDEAIKMDLLTRKITDRLSHLNMPSDYELLLSGKDLLRDDLLNGLETSLGKSPRIATLFEANGDSEILTNPIYTTALGLIRYRIESAKRTPFIPQLHLQRPLAARLTEKVTTFLEDYF